MDWGLYCPVCKEARSRRTSGRKNWSDSQWLFGKAVLESKSGFNVDTNCCRICSPEYYKVNVSNHGAAQPPYTQPNVGSPPSTQPNVGSPPPPPGPLPNGPHSDATSPPADNDYSEFSATCSRLTRALPTAFWQKFHSNVMHYGYGERVYSNIKEHVSVTMARHPEWSWQLTPSPLKWLSYHGAVKTHHGGGVVDSCWSCEFTGEKFFEPGNETYAYVLRMLWPRALPDFHNRETIGDVFEAFLGYGYLMDLAKPDRWTSYQRGIIADLDFVLWFVYVHWSTTFGGRAS